MMTRIFDKVMRLSLGIVLIFLSSCMSKKPYDTTLMNESILYGRAGEHIKDVYFEAEVDDTSEESKKAKMSPSDTVIRLRSRGFPRGSCYNLYMTRIDGVRSEYGRVVANEEGKLMLQEAGSIPLENFMLNHFGCMRGEELYYTLVSFDGSTYLTTSMGSDSIRAKAKDGAILAIKMRSPNADFFTVGGQGFIPEERIDLINIFADKRAVTPAIVSEDGNWSGTFKIDLNLHKGGIGSIQVKRQDGEILSAEYIWGVDSRKSIKGLRR